jgi:hypothetical protein
MRRLDLVGLAGVALGLTAEWVGFGWSDPRRWIPDLAVGWTSSAADSSLRGGDRRAKPARSWRRPGSPGLWGTSRRSV